MDFEQTSVDAHAEGSDQAVHGDILDAVVQPVGQPQPRAVVDQHVLGVVGRVGREPRHAKTRGEILWGFSVGHEHSSRTFGTNGREGGHAFHEQSKCARYER
jgi:hypothetical protein